MTGCNTCGGFGDRHDPIAHAREDAANAPAAAVALGDQIQARVSEIARQLLDSQLQGEVLTDDETAAFDAGVGAGSAAALLALREFGVLQ